MDCMVSKLLRALEQSRACSFCSFMARGYPEDSCLSIAKFPLGLHGLSPDEDHFGQVMQMCAQNSTFAKILLRT